MHPPPPTPKSAQSPTMPPRDGPKRPTLVRRARTARGATSESWTFDTRRGYSHYSQTTANTHPAPTALGSHSHAPVHAHAHTTYAHALLQTPYIPVIGALPAIAAGVQSIRKWHARGQTLAPQGLAFGQAQAILERFLRTQDAPPAENAHACHIALTTLLREHVDKLALHKAAIVRAIDEGSTKTASACCELFTFLLVPLPAIHTLLGVEAGSTLMRPYTTLIIPAAFLVTAGLQIAHNAERLQEAFGLWQQARAAAICATGAARSDLRLPAMGDAALPRALMRECLYAGVQVFFWTAFACGMSAASGSMFVGLVSPPVAVVCLLVGVVGTTVLHMGWANAYSTPDRIDDATPEDFGSLARRRRHLAALSEEAQHIELFRLHAATHLTPVQASLFQTILPVLEAVPQANTAVQWLVDRWFAPVADSVGPLVLAHLTRLCETRLASQRASLEALQRVLPALETDEGRRALGALPGPVQVLANQALAQQQNEREHITAIVARLSQLHHQLTTTNEQANWRAAAHAWLSVDDEEPSLERPEAGIYRLLMRDALNDIRREQKFLTWTQRVGVGAESSL